jgi:hypothetical protein
MRRNTTKLELVSNPAPFCSGRNFDFAEVSRHRFSTLIGTPDLDQFHSVGINSEAEAQLWL